MHCRNMSSTRMKLGGGSYHHLKFSQLFLQYLDVSSTPADFDCRDKKYDADARAGALHQWQSA